MAAMMARIFLVFLFFFIFLDNKLSSGTGRGGDFLPESRAARPAGATARHSDAKSKETTSSALRRPPHGRRPLPCLGALQPWAGRANGIKTSFQRTQCRCKII